MTAALYSCIYGVAMIQIHLKELLKERDMTMADLSYDTRIGRSSISHIARGDAKAIGLETLDRICRSLGCTVDDILEYVEDEANGTDSVE